MNGIVRAVLPLMTWHFQKIFGPVFSADEWRAWALALVPPPDNVAKTIEREWAEYDSPALLSSSARRRLRRWAQECLRCQLRNDPFVLPTREYLRNWRAAMEAKGYKADLSRLGRWRDVETERTMRLLNLFSGDEPPDELKAIIKSHPDALPLLWELTTYGFVQENVKLRRNSALYSIFGIDRSLLENARPEDAPVVFSHLFRHLGLEGDPPDQGRLLRLIWWFVSHLLPAESEPVKASDVLAGAVEAGLIHKGVVTSRNEQTGEVDEIDVVDLATTQPDFLGLESNEAIVAYFAHKGINYDDLTPKEWAEIFERRDIMSLGYEFGSKRGVSISAFYGEAAQAKEKRWSRLLKKIDALRRMAK